MFRVSPITSALSHPCRCLTFLLLDLDYCLKTPLTITPPGIRLHKREWLNCCRHSSANTDSSATRRIRRAITAASRSASASVTTRYSSSRASSSGRARHQHRHRGGNNTNYSRPSRPSSGRCRPRERHRRHHSYSSRNRFTLRRITNPRQLSRSLIISPTPTPSSSNLRHLRSSRTRGRPQSMYTALPPAQHRPPSPR